ncbi:MAG TPA: hypothetical protein VFU46_14920 [Gemmatimonadales bacterium]|nr:hypothetical protein [Gemmatimonadales bacterium]
MRCRLPVLAVAIAVAAAGCAPEAAQPPSRDLTILAVPAEPVVAGPVELARSSGTPIVAAAAESPVRRPRAVRQPAVPVEPAPEPAAERLATAPLVSADAPAADAPMTDSWTGAGRALEPGQSVGVVPAVATGGSAQMPPTELVSATAMRRRWGGGIHGGDRCIPGRDELLPGYRGRRR